MRSLTSVALFLLLISMVLPQGADARGAKGFGGFKNFGLFRSSEQKNLNMQQPRGKARASAEHLLDVFRKGGHGK